MAYYCPKMAQLCEQLRDGPYKTFFSFWQNERLVLSLCALLEILLLLERYIVAAILLLPVD